MRTLFVQMKRLTTCSDRYSDVVDEASPTAIASLDKSLFISEIYDMNTRHHTLNGMQCVCVCKVVHINRNLCGCISGRQLKH